MFSLDMEDYNHAKVNPYKLKVFKIVTLIILIIITLGVL